MTKALKKAEDLYEQSTRDTGFRILFAIMVPFICLIGIFYLYNQGNPFLCVFHEVTGLYCPGCGTGRALRSLLHLDIKKALDYNMLFIISFPFIAYYCFVYYTRIVFGKNVLPYIKTTPKTALFLLILIILYTVLRNIPYYPFSILAP